MWKMSESSTSKSSSSTTDTRFTWNFAFNLIHFRCAFGFQSNILGLNICSRIVHVLLLRFCCYWYACNAQIWHHFLCRQWNKTKSTPCNSMAIKNSLYVLFFVREQTHTYTDGHIFSVYRVSVTVWKWAKCALNENRSEKSWNKKRENLKMFVFFLWHHFWPLMVI